MDIIDKIKQSAEEALTAYKVSDTKVEVKRIPESDIIRIDVILDMEELADDWSEKGSRLIYNALNSSFLCQLLKGYDVLATRFPDNLGVVKYITSVYESEFKKAVNWESDNG